MKSFDVIIAEKRKRALQKKNETPKDGEAASKEEQPKNTKLQMSRQTNSSKPTTGKKDTFTFKGWEFDHLKWTCDGAFEQLFGLRRGEFEHLFFKTSMHWGCPERGC